LSVFSNPTIQSTFDQSNGNSISWFAGFGMYSLSGTVYNYLMDYDASKVFILNDQWSFISFKVFTNPAFMISISNCLYMTGQSNVWKLDQDLNILINYNPGGSTPSYRGISYNPSNGLIYVAARYLIEIQVFNLDLSLIRLFSTSPNTPYSMTFSSNQLYVGTSVGMILRYQNEILINQFGGCNGNSDYLRSILFDPNGYMATSCYSNKLYLFSSNGSFTNKSITTPLYPQYIDFDTKDRFIQISAAKQISIYN